uniref:DDRGK domain-containing protein 1 n=1 Tax=Saimiri boliviensis boliviensis TaxID=39432 RepID=A0A2K6SG79_SAIBB
MVASMWYLVAAALLVGFILFLTRSRGRAASAGQEPLHNEEELAGAGWVAQPQPLEPEESRAGGRPRRRRDLGSRLQAQRRAQRVTWAEADENEEEAVVLAQEEEDIEKPAEAHVSGKIGAKKLRKLEEKQARKAQREAEEAEREERKRLESQREAEWKKEEERLRLEEEQKEEEERKAREEQAQREHEEYLKLKEAFVVEEEGVGETMTEEQSQSFLTEFINYIKQSKVVLLEDLASQVGLRTQDTINRIQDLLAEGTVTGVIDDRGKFIYITPEELAAVANFIRQRGRVSIAELAQASNSLIAWGREPSAQAPA